MVSARRFRSEHCRLEDFRAIVEQNTDLPPSATQVQQGVPLYDAARLRPLLAENDHTTETLLDELNAVLDTGPGVFVIRAAYERTVLDRVTQAFEAMIEEQRAEGRAVGDHYAAPGANDRIWNSIEKLAVADPDAFVDYFANDMLALGALAWLGPGYQISAQVNRVNPGGTAQKPHRDYHLGFMTVEEAEEFPATAHLLSPSITLQGAVAHCDMPVESGPTMLLPHSHKYGPGYVAWRREEFVEYFTEHAAQLPLAAGDLLYFNPALFHAAGTNHTTDVWRLVNLLQISSAMGRSMETVDRIRMTNAVYPTLLRRQVEMSASDVRRVVAAIADGYAFPTNLDRDPPLDGLTPPSHEAIVREALRQQADPLELQSRLDSLVRRRRTHDQ